jgi:hypothetical protein
MAQNIVHMFDKTQMSYLELYSTLSDRNQNVQSKLRVQLSDGAGASHGQGPGFHPQLPKQTSKQNWQSWNNHAMMLMKTCSCSCGSAGVTQPEVPSYLCQVGVFLFQVSVTAEAAHCKPL